MSSSLLQSRRLSSSLWSEHTLITCVARVKDKLKVSVARLGGSKVGSEKDPYVLPRDSQRKSTGVGCHCLLRGEVLINVK